MAEIRELSKSMINKIAAGEVIERPGAVVKELVENSVDAGAKRIVVEIEKSGVESIKVVDDGDGIPADQFLAALSPHSTSKIANPEDLFHICTLGFRGEALASIAEVSQLTLSSRFRDAKEGAQIPCNGGERGEIKPLGRDVGTTVEVRNLFFNTPVRRKFLRTPQTEFAHVQEALVRIAIPHTEVAFTLKHNGRTVLDLPTADDMLQRLRRVFGESIASKLIKVESQRRDVRISGYVGSPDLARGSATMQYLFINGRFFRDKALQHALTEAYRGLQLVGKYPVAFIGIETPPDFVDVNVHPTKQEARFLDGQAMYAGPLAGIRDQFERSDLISRPTVEEVRAAAGLPDGEKPAPDPTDPDAALDSSVADSRARSALDWLDQAKAQRQARLERSDASDSPREPAGLDGRPASKPALSPEPRRTVSSFDSRDSMIDDANAALQEAAEEARRARASQRFRNETSVAEAPSLAAALSGGAPEFKKFPPLGGAPSASPASPASAAPLRSKPDVPPASSANAAASPESDAADAPKDDAEREREFASLRAKIAANNRDQRVGAAGRRRVAWNSEGKPVLQACNRYLVMEARDGEGILLVDQHALHERILFQKLKASVASGNVIVQTLLAPIALDLTPTEAAFVAENKDLFAAVGIIAKEFGGNTVVIDGYPALLSSCSPRDVFQIALGVFLEKRSGADITDLIDDALKQSACKAAIKAGDALTPESMIELIALAEEEKYFHHCPHGRPSVLALSCDKIDALFKRT